MDCKHKLLIEKYQLTSNGSTVLFNDLLIFLPSAALTKPCENTHPEIFVSNILNNGFYIQAYQAMKFWLTLTCRAKLRNETK